MSSANPLAILEIAERNELEALLMEFEQAWNPESLKEFGQRVASNPRQQYRDLAMSELVKTDLQRSWSAGRGRLLEAYLGQFPSLGNPESIGADLIVAEFEARSSVDSELALAGYESRFPKQFKQVKQLAHQLRDSSVNDSSPKRTADHRLQASIDTSRIDELRDTKAGKKQAKTVVDLPVEFGRYRILRELGSGAMGKVYLAHDSQLDRQVAIKTPSFAGGHDDELVTRFYREARAAAQIHHRNICPIYDVGEIDGRHFISMGFVKGRCMSEFIKSGRRPPERTSAVLVQRLAVALAEAHHHNVIHRDLKPANIMIDLKKEPVVMDFGLARQMDVESRVTQSGMAVGTPAYMSPEQIRGDLNAVGTTADIYALGVILYELLTGRIPFRGPIAKVVYRIVHEEPVAPSEIREGIEPELEAICARMMAKDQAERFQTMEEVADALKAYLKGNTKTTKTRTSERESTAPFANVEQLTETGALNAFFAAKAQQDPMHTAIEPCKSTGPTPVVQSEPKASSQHGGGRSKLIALGLGGFALLAGVIIYFSDGSKVEIEDGTQAVVTTNADGTLKSITTSPQSTRQSTSRDSAASGSLTHDDAQPGFVDLFNGSDLSGWRGITGLWSWEDGQLVGRAGLNGQRPLRKNTVLCSDKSYRDFELLFDVKMENHSGSAREDDEPNTGIQFRSRIVDHDSYKVAGPQADIGGKYCGGLWGEGTTGLMYKVEAGRLASIVRTDDWNQYRLVVEGDHIAITLNGVETVNRTFPDMQADGILGFQLHQNKRMTARFRNIRIRELDRSLAARTQPESEVAPQIMTDLETPDTQADPDTAFQVKSVSGGRTDEGWIDLFNGDDLSGWKQVHSENVWSVRDGCIESRSSKNGESVRGWLETEQAFMNFELALEYFMPRDGNSGIFLRTRSGASVIGKDQLEIQLLDDTGSKYKNVGSQQLTGAIYGVVAPQPKSNAQANAWNKMKIRAVGSQITVVVNGVTIVNTNLNSITRKISGRFQYALPGPVALQWHGHKVRFRRIQIQELDSSGNELNQR